MKKILAFIKKETVLTAAWILAVISMFLVPPSRSYLSYIDFKSLGILWSLMVVMEGFRRIGFFDAAGQKLLRKAGNTHQLSIVLVLLCFFSSMFITNDVALITFVPFAIFMLESCGREDILIPVITLQTLAANLGSMLMPIGNPQNLYLYGLSSMKIGEFIRLMLPYSLLSLLLLVASTFFLPKRSEPVAAALVVPHNKLSYRKLIAYGVLFVSAILTVAGVMPYYVLVAAVFTVIFLIDKKAICNIDYALLFTFAGFFIFTGNIGNIEAVNSWLTSLVKGNEVVTGILTSQFISNVPAALLLSGFTRNYRELIVGVNLGGMGTLIASMASLISYKLLAHSHNDKKGKYLIFFTVMNIIYIAVLLLANISFL